MPRDYKHRATQRKRRRKISPLTGIGAGLLLGLFVAFLVYLKLQSPAEPPAYFQESLLPPVEQTRPDSATARPADSGTATPRTTQAPPPPPKPRFDFYTLLPEMEVVVPEEEVPPPPAPPPPPRQPEPAAATARVEPPPAPAAAKAVEQAPARPASAVPATDSYLLQVGSFRSAEQAERLKAELALLGLQTSIQKVTIDNRNTFHRVRVGPFRDTGAMNNARSRLSKKGIESQVIKLR